MRNKYRMQTDLTNKVALITGAAKGLGAYYAKLLANNGAHVIVTGRKNSKNGLNNLVEELMADGNKASALILDIREISTFKDKVAEIVDQFKHIDILINNAAVTLDQSFFEVDEANWNLHFDTNLKGLFFLSQAVADQMRSQEGYKSIINIAAVNGQKVRKNCIPLGASKAGVIHLTKMMAYELIDDKIKVNAISLGLFPSEAVEKYLQEDPSAKDYLNRIPAKRAGDFADLDGPLLLLASDASNYMNGSIINVDGGFSSDVFMPAK
ncbi:MAG: hypothetical protein A3F18_01525 [Legionellales bacterium RIFCSPHIGHO2_12_FULL_37_14]|nr:MAG: hypothetical protein A3F18_01525 [Legionellales bacterium RIFCSPHIGHO2_12_FULL_37_14]